MVFLVNMLFSKTFWIAVIVAALMGKAWLWHHGKVVEAVEAERHAWEVKLAAADEKRREEVAGWVVEMHKRVDLERSAAKLRLDNIKADTARQIERVRAYVTANADRNCVVSRGFVQSRNAAAAGATLPGTPGTDVDAPSGVALSDVAANDAENAGEFRQCVARLDAFKRAWAREAEQWNRFAEQLNKESPALSGTP